MEPSPAKKQKIDLRQLTPEDSDAMRKLMGNMEKHLKAKSKRWENYKWNCVTKRSGQTGSFSSDFCSKNLCQVPTGPN
jgi:hypothetical protein